MSTIFEIRRTASPTVWKIDLSDSFFVLIRRWQNSQFLFWSRLSMEWKDVVLIHPTLQTYLRHWCRYYFLFFREIDWLTENSKMQIPCPDNQFCTFEYVTEFLIGGKKKSKNNSALTLHVWILDNLKLIFGSMKNQGIFLAKI